MYVRGRFKRQPTKEHNDSQSSIFIERNRTMITFQSLQGSRALANFPLLGWKSMLEGSNLRAFLQALWDFWVANTYRETCFLEPRFFTEKPDLLRIVLSLKYNYNFWRVRVDFRGPQKRPKTEKVSLAAFKNHSQKQCNKNIIVQKIERALHPLKWCSRCFWKMRLAKQERKLWLSELKNG